MSWQQIHVEAQRMHYCGVEVWGKLVERLRKRGLTDEDIYRLASEEGVLDTVTEQLMKMSATRRARYPVKCTHRSLKDALAACNFDYVDSSFVADYSHLEGEVLVNAEFVLHHFNSIINGVEAISELEQLDLRIPSVPEILAFSGKFPDIQFAFPIVALSSRSVVLSGGCERIQIGDFFRWRRIRRLNRCSSVGSFCAECRFLVVPK